MASKVKVLLIGGGGVGTIAALNLEAVGSACVSMVLRSNYEHVIEKGYEIHSVDHGQLHGWRPSQVLNKVPKVRQGNSQEYDFIVVTTKNIPNSSVSLVDIVLPAVSERAVIVLIQNGLNIEKPFMATFPENIILSGISMIGSGEVERGIIHHIGQDTLLVGAFPGQRLDQVRLIEASRRFSDLYSASGKAICDYDCDVARSRWRKLVYNACLNPICAITGLDTGRIRLAYDTVETLVRPAMEEIRAAAAAAGHPLPEDVADVTLEIDPIEMCYVPSMLEDVRKGNLIEHENILGEPLRTGTALGVPMPTISFLYSTCKAIQWRTMNAKGP